MVVAGISLNTVPCTIIYSVAIVVYNEGGLAVIPVVKNFLGAIGLACYCWGTTIILGRNSRSRSLAHAESFQTTAESPKVPRASLF